MSNKHHFHLVNAKVLFLIEGQDDAAQSAEFNAIIRAEHQHVTSRQLAHAQKQAQVQLHQAIGESAKYNVANVILTNVSYLGHMTDAEFTAGAEATEEAQSAVKGAFV